MGIGTTSPSALFSVGSASQFQINSSGVATYPIGDVNNPSIVFANSSNTGFWSSASQTLNVSVNGNERLRINSSGNVGIGTNDPVSVLHTNSGHFTLGSLDSSNAAEIRLREGSSNGTEYVSLKAPNAVTTSVTFTLPSADGTSGQVLRTDGSGMLSWAANASGGGMTNPMSNTGDIIYASDTNSPSTPARLGIGSNGQCLIISAGLPTWGSCSGTSAAAGSNTQIQFNNSGSFGASANFIWDNTNYTLSSLGTIAGAKISLALRNSSTGSTSTNELRIGNNSSANALSLIVNSSGYTGAVNYAYIYNTLNAPLLFGTNNAERVRITNTGNVGIGTTTPSAILDIEGSAAGITTFEVGGEDTNTGLIARFKRPNSLEADIIVGTINNADAYIASESNLHLATAQSGQSLGTARLTILSAGNVGIGTTNPGAKLDVNGIAAFGLGAVGAPSLAFRTDLDTGIWGSGSDTISFSTAGAERMRVAAAGNVGVGTTNPLALLDVNGVAAVGLGAVGAPGLAFRTDLNTGIWSSGADTLNFSTAGSERFRVSSAGNVGIGTNAPGQIFTVGSDTFQVNSSGNLVKINNIVYSWPSSQAGGANYVLTNNGSGTLSWLNASTINAFTQSGNSFGAAAVFGTNDGYDLTLRTNGTEKMRVSTSGNVGVGVTAPLALLDVNGVGAHGLGAVTLPSFAFRTDLNTGMWSSGADTINFSTNANERLRISSTGSVGIGTTNPLAVLDVNGVAAVGQGAVGAPGLAFRTDLNTGIWSSGVDTLNFSTAGAERMRISSAGNVGIGVTVPNQFFTVGSDTFQINSSGNVVKINNVAYSWPASQAAGASYVLSNNGSGTLTWVNANSINAFAQNGNSFAGNAVLGTNDNYALTFEVNNTERMRIATSGNVGIGTSNPNQLLTVGSDTFQVNSSGNLVKINNIAYSWPAAQAAASNYVLTNNGAGALTWETAGTIDGGSMDLGVDGSNNFYIGVDSWQAETIVRIQNDSELGTASLFVENYIESGSPYTLKLRPNAAANNTTYIDVSAWQATTTTVLQNTAELGIANLFVEGTIESGTNNTISLKVNPAANYTTYFEAYAYQTDTTLRLQNTDGYSTASLFVEGTIESGTDYTLTLKPNPAASYSTYIDVTAYNTATTTYLRNTNGGTASLSVQAGIASGTDSYLAGSSGNVGIGLTSGATQKLDVNGNARIRSIGSGAYTGAVNRMADGTLTTATSDVRLKQDITTIGNSLDKVMALRGVTFSWKDANNPKRMMGMIAQEVMGVAPELVFQNPDGYYGVNYGETSGLLIEAIKEQQLQISSLTSTLNNSLSKEDQEFQKLNTALALLTANTQDQATLTNQKITSIQSNLTTAGSQINLLSAKLNSASNLLAQNTQPDQVLPFYQFEAQSSELSSPLTDQAIENNQFAGTYDSPDNFQEINLQLHGENQLDLEEKDQNQTFLSYDVYIEDPTSLEDYHTELGNIMDQKELQWDRLNHPYFISGWNTIKLSLTDGIKTGDIDFEHLNYFRAYFKFNKNTNLKFKNIRIETKASYQPLAETINNQNLDLLSNTDQGTALKSIFSELDSIKTQDLASLQVNTKLTNDLKTMQDQVALLQKQADTFTQFLLAFDVNSIDNFAKKNAPLNTFTGQLEAEGMVAGAFSVKVVDESAATIGIGAINIFKDDNSDGIDDNYPGNSGKNIIIKTKAVSANSKIYITPISSTKNQVLYVGEVTPGVSFEVRVDSLVTEEIKFNWWMVEKE